MPTRIIIDSTADMIPQLKTRTAVVPLTVHFDNEEYVDGVTITHQQFYEKLVETDVLPRTSQAGPDAFAKAYRAAADAGEEAVVLTISEKLSGTYYGPNVVPSYETEETTGETVAESTAEATEAPAETTQAASDAAQE